MIKKAHVIGICGVGMSATAILLKQMGYIVSGSDEDAYDPVYSAILKSGISVEQTYSEKNISEDVSLVIIGMSAKLNPEINPEVAFARKLEKEGKLEVKSYPVVMDEIIFSNYKKRFVVSGSYAKSTSTAMLAFALSELGINPGYFVGAIFTNENYQHCQLGKPEIVVLEGDEYPVSIEDSRSKFIVYKPTTLLLTACAHDHFNKFPTLEEYLKPYTEMIKIMSDNPDSKIVANIEAPNVLFVLDKANKSYVTFGKSDTNDYYYQIDQNLDGETYFSIFKKGQKMLSSKSLILGEHNILNWTGVVALLDQEKISIEILPSIISKFTGLKRRLERLSSLEKIPVYESFGSSFDKAVSDIKAIRDSFPKRKIIVFFEPHTFAFKDKLAKNWYTKMFNDCEMVYFIKPPDKHGKNLPDQLSIEEMIEVVTKSGTKATAVENPSDLKNILAKLDTNKNVTVLISSGDTSQHKIIIKETL